MAKNSPRKKTRASSKAPTERNISISKQAIGGVTGAVVGAMVGGPIGAIAGGVAGTVVGEQSARGKRPVARTAETIGEEIRKGTPMKALKSVAGATASLARPKKKSAKSPMAAASTTGGRKKGKASSKRKATSAKKGTMKRAKKGGRKKKS
jgi:hypothetical protein